MSLLIEDKEMPETCDGCDFHVYHSHGEYVCVATPMFYPMNLANSKGIRKDWCPLKEAPEPCEDAVSRQAAIDALVAGEPYDIEHNLKAVRELPSVTPEPETTTMTVGRTKGEITMWYECDNCGEPVNQSDNYCRNCGRKFRKDGDTISRQAALKICRQYWHPTFNPIMEEIEKLPSAQQELCEDAVSRKYLLDEYDRQHKGAPGGARKIIENAPSVMLKPRTGRWLINSDGYYPYCSECKAEPKSGEMTGYCPSCGAKMEG